MDTTLPLEKRPVSYSWRLPIIGAVVGVAFTYATIFFGEFSAQRESMMGYLLRWSTFLTLWPAQHIFRLFGWHWDWISRSSWGPVSLLFPAFVVFITNALILALVGAGFGFLKQGKR
jgi:hypothetical protein